MKNEPNTYEEKIICPNCGKANQVNIPRGQTIFDFKNKNNCFYCDCRLSGASLGGGGLKKW